MARIIGALLLLGVIIMAFKIAAALLLLAGLIFRTKETVGLLALFAAWALFWKAPVVSCVIIGLVALIALYKAASKKDGATGQAPALTDEPDD